MLGGRNRDMGGHRGCSPHLGGAREAASGFLSWMHWVEQEVRRLPDLLEGLGLLKGAMMAVAVAEIGWDP